MLQRKTGLPWKQGATAKSHTGGGATTVASLSQHASACLWTIKAALSGLALVRQPPSNRKTPLRAGPHTPAAGCQKRPSLGPYLLCPWPLASLHIWRHGGSRDPSSRTTSAPGLHCGTPKRSKAASVPDSCGWTTHRGGDKTKAEPQRQGN